MGESVCVREVASKSWRRAREREETGGRDGGEAETGESAPSVGGRQSTSTNGHEAFQRQRKRAWPTAASENIFIVSRVHARA